MQQQSESMQAILRELEQREVSADEAAKMFRQSTSRFRHQFKSLIGVSFRTARLRSKLGRGAVLLQTTNLSVADIAAHLGYSDRSKFDKAFKRVFGSTPSRFRKW